MLLLKQALNKINSVTAAVTVTGNDIVIVVSVCHLTVALQGPLSMGFLRQEYWSGLPFPSPGDFPDLGIEPGSPALQADSLPLSHWGYIYTLLYNKSVELFHLA